jgi:hypothetical protein
MSPDVIGVFVPIVAIVMGVGLAMLSEVTSYRRRSQALAQRHAERLAAIEKGVELPPDAGDPDAQIELAKALRPPRYLLRGLVYGGIGAALVLSWPGGDHPIRTVGWVLAAVGVAHVIYYAIEGRKERRPQQPPDQAAG